MSILKKPLISEKNSKLNERSVYGFVVNSKANKVQIKKEIEKIYNVNIVKVNTMKYKGKAITKYKKNRVVKGTSPSYKKAFIYLKQGEILDFFSEM